MVTGADGFIGSHLCEALVAHGAEVTAFCYYNSFDSRGWLDWDGIESGNALKVVLGDIRDADRVAEVAKDCDVIFHLAALIGIPYSYSAPQSYIETNVTGTLNVLQAARRYSLQRVVVTSTSEVYGSAIYTPIDEEHPLQAQSPYSASKIAADKLAESFWRSFELPVVVARPFNAYGPRQSARAVIPTIISQLLNGSGKVSLGSLEPRRDFNFVKDLTAGFIALGECDQAVGREINIGSGSDVSIGEVAQMLIDICGTPAEIVSADERKRPQMSEVNRLLCGNSLITSLTSWRPVTSLEDGLRRTVEWYRTSRNVRYRDQFTV